MEQVDVERSLLKLIKSTGAVLLYEATRPDLNPRFRERLKKFTAIDCEASAAAFCEAVWSLASKRLVWISFEHRDPGYWRIFLTARGHEVAADDVISPDDPGRFMERIMEIAPRTTLIVRRYLEEALKSHFAECYLASSVMLGVAAESTTLETAAKFVSWPGSNSLKLGEILDNPRRFYVYKLEEFQKRLSEARSRIPSELSDNLELNITTVLQLIRLTRNDAGHPTGRQIDAEESHQNLVVYSNVHRKLHRLMDFFASGIAAA